MRPPRCHPTTGKYGTRKAESILSFSAIVKKKVDVPSSCFPSTLVAWSHFISTVLSDSGLASDAKINTLI